MDMCYIIFNRSAPPPQQIFAIMDEYCGEDFGPTVDLTTRITEITEAYSVTSVCKERAVSWGRTATLQVWKDRKFGGCPYLGGSAGGGVMRTSLITLCAEAA